MQKMGRKAVDPQSVLARVCSKICAALLAEHAGEGPIS
jgi:hypothetical protein